MAIENVLIVGAGIAGTTLAINLQMRGISAHVVELTEEVVGVGIFLTANTLRALHQLDLLDEAVELGFPSAVWRAYDAAGNHLMDTSIPSGLGPGYPSSIGMERPALAQLLRSRAKRVGARIDLGVSIVGLTDVEQGVEVEFTTGHKHTYDLVVGADGAHSKVRALISQDQHLEPTGESAWRWYTKRHPAVDTTMFFHGRRKLGLVPLSETSMYLLIVDTMPADLKLSPDQILVELRERLSEFSAPVIEDLKRDLNSDSYISYRPLQTLWIDDSWHSGRTVLIGDASHSVAPHLGNGGGMAIEDAIVLAEELDGSEDVEAALRRFEQRRFDRCKMVHVNSLRMCLLEAQGGDEAEIYEIVSTSFDKLMEPI